MRLIILQNTRPYYKDAEAFTFEIWETQTTDSFAKLERINQYSCCLLLEVE